MNKKFLVLSFVMLLLMCIFVSNVYAYSITSATISITASKTEYNPGDTVEFTVSLKDLNADSGILGFGAYVEYNSDLLELNTHTQGLSGWDNAVISDSTKRFAATKWEHSANNEDILKISFKVKDITSDTNTSISLKNIEISNGSEYRISNVSSNSISIKLVNTNPSNPDNPNNPGTDNPNNPNNPGNQDTPDQPTNPGNQSGDNNNNNNNNNDNNSINTPNTNNDTSKNNSIEGTFTNNSSSNKSNSDLPPLGANRYLSILLVIVAITTMFLIIRMKLLNNKINKEAQKKSDENNKI